MKRIWFWLFTLSLRQLRTKTSYCANRITSKFKVKNHFEITVESRDTEFDDAYERSEILEMLTKVRKAEKTQHWQCPEPEL